MALDVPVQLEEVFVFEGGPDGFPELVLCHGIHAGIGYDLGVVAVDYFAKMKAWGWEVRTWWSTSRQNSESTE
ncbi:hypothetical protein CIP107550_02413 [Corynebacterium diphtheriae]|nr:hypothetical protein CIP107550_02413 [Corynebacterium diphtheriae]